MRFLQVMSAVGAVFIILAACSAPEDRAAKHLERAQEYFDAGEFVTARLEAQNAAQIEPKNADARYLLALIAEQQEQYRNVFGHLMVAVAAEPEHVESRIKLGTVLYLAEIYDQAEEHARIAMELAPDNVAARVLNARVLAQKGQREAALADIEAALSIDPDYVEAVLLEVAAYALTDRDKAMGILDTAIARVGPARNKVLRQTRLMMLAQDERLDDLEAEYRGLMKDFPDEQTFRYALAGLLISQNRISDAEDLLRTVVAQHPEDIKTRLELAQFLARLRSPEAAQTALRGFVDDMPDALELRLALARHYDENGLRDDAMREFTEIGLRSPRSDIGLQARNRVATMMLENNAIAEGRAMIDGILDDSPDNVEALFSRATLNSLEGRYEEVLADLRIVLRNNPESRPGLLALARAHHNSGDPVLAKDAYRSLLDLESAHAEASNELAALLSASGELAEAESVLRLRLAAEPADEAASNRLVELFLEQRRLDEAEEVARSLLAANVGSPIGHFALGRVLQAKQQFREAADTYQVALEKSPLSNLAAEGMVRAMIAGDLVNEAIQYLEAHLAEYPEAIVANFLLGTLLANKGDYDRAITIYEDVLEKTAPTTLVYTALASAYPTDPEIRIEIYERALAEIPGDLGLVLLVGQDYQLVGRFEDAIALYTRVLAENPELHGLANDLAALLLDHRSDEKSYEQALELASRFSRTSVPAALDTLGWALYRTGNYELAVTYLERAVLADDDRPELRYHLGMAYLALDNPVGARQELDRAITQAQAADGSFTGIEDARATLASLEDS